MPAVMGKVDWYDPRTWESYRNFWGFDRPKARADGSFPYRARMDNWGTPLQMFENVPLVTRYGKRIGFRPTPAQLERHKALSARYDIAYLAGDHDTVASLQQEIAALEASAQGELPNPTTYKIIGYGDPHPNWHSLTNKEHREIDRKNEEVAVKNLYKRLGIPHLYEFYEKP